MIKILEAKLVMVGKFLSQSFRVHLTYVTAYPAESIFLM